MIGNMHPYHPVVLRPKALIDEGCLGK